MVVPLQGAAQEQNRPFSSPWESMSGSVTLDRESPIKGHYCESTPRDLIFRLMVSIKLPDIEGDLS